VITKKPLTRSKCIFKNSSLTVPFKVGRPLILYLIVKETVMGCVLGHHSESGMKGQDIYYLSEKFNDYESRYTAIEKLGYALVLGTKRLNHICCTTQPG
jgi:hypothetical protein